jgi:hypothetical protein
LISAGVVRVEFEGAFQLALRAAKS